MYNHFAQKGFWNSDNLPNVSKLNKEDKKKLCVEFTSIFKTNLNNSKYTDGVVTYWLTPPYASGHCWQPHNAIISDTDTGYAVTNEEFIPDNYNIDSVSSVNGKITIYGYDYECARDKIIKKFRVTLSKL